MREQEQQRKVEREPEVVPPAKEARRYPHLVGFQEPYVAPSALWITGWL